MGYTENNKTLYILNIWKCAYSDPYIWHFFCVGQHIKYFKIRFCRFVRYRIDNSIYFEDLNVYYSDPHIFIFLCSSTYKVLSNSSFARLWDINTINDMQIFLQFYRFLIKGYLELGRHKSPLMHHACTGPLETMHACTGPPVRRWFRLQPIPNPPRDM